LWIGGSIKTLAFLANQQNLEVVEPLIRASTAQNLDLGGKRDSTTDNTHHHIDKLTVCQ
jgi:hypothetical protein